jgi:hypothetical protein
MAIWTIDGVTFEFDLFIFGFCTLEDPAAELASG